MLVGVVMPKSKKIDHVSFAVEDIDEVISFFTDVLGAEGVKKGNHERDGYKYATFELGASKVELMAPLRDDGFVAKFIERRGEGFNHFTVQVEDIEEVISALEKRGIKIHGEVSRGQGWKSAFIHPRDAYGVLIQLLEGSWD